MATLILGITLSGEHVINGVSSVHWGVGLNSPAAASVAANWLVTAQIGTSGYIPIFSAPSGLGPPGPFGDYVMPLSLLAYIPSGSSTSTLTFRASCWLSSVQYIATASWTVTTPVPAISSFTAQRCSIDGAPSDEGQYVSILVNDIISSANGNAVTSRSIKYGIAGTDPNTFALLGSYTNNTSKLFTNVLFPIGQAYDFLATVVDSFGSSSKRAKITTAFDTLSFRAGGHGVAIGKISEKDAFECAMDAEFTGAVFGIFPVGAIYMSINPDNPSSIFGGTWAAWGSGRVPVGINTNDSDFFSVQQTGGYKSVALNIPEMPSHNHTQNSHYHSMPETYFVGDNPAGTGFSIPYSDAANTSHHTSSVTPTNNPTGGGQPHNNLQPYITCYMWVRTV